MLILASASPRRRELLTQAGFIFTVHPAHIPEEPLPSEDPIAYVTRLARQKAEIVFNQLTTLGAPGPSHLGTGESTNIPASDQRASAPPQAAGTPGPSPSGTWESTNLAPAPPPISGPDLKGTGFSPDLKGTGFSPYITPAKDPRALAPEGTLTVLGADTTVTLDNHILGKPENEADAARMLSLLSGRTHRVITGVALVTAQRTEVAAEVTAVQFLTLSEEEIAAYIATGEPMDKAGAYAIQGRAARWIPRIEGDYSNVVGLPLSLVCTLLASH